MQQAACRPVEVEVRQRMRSGGVVTIRQFFPSKSGTSPACLVLHHREGVHSEELSQFKKAVADWAVGAGFSVMTKKSDKYVLLSHLSTMKFSIERSQNSHGAISVCALKSCPFRVYVSWHQKEKCYRRTSGGQAYLGWCGSTTTSSNCNCTVGHFPSANAMYKGPEAGQRSGG